MSSASSSAASSNKGTSLFKAAGLIAFVTIISKFLGLFRDQAISYAYGAGSVSDAYNTAFQVVSFALILLGGVGGPFHTATIAVLKRMLPNHERPNKMAKDLVAGFITLTACVFTVLTVLVWVKAAWIVHALAPKAPLQTQHIATLHLQWMSPMILIGGVIGIFYGVSILYDKYVWPSLSPSAINVTLVAWILFIGADNLGLALAISTLIGAVLQLALQLPEFFKLGFTAVPHWSWFGGEAKEEMGILAKMIIPATIGTTIGQLNVYVAMFFASQLMEGSWTAYTMANRLIQLPLGVLTIGLLTPLFPRFSQAVVDKNQPQLVADFTLGLKSMWLVGLPVVALITLLAPAGIQLLFQRGEFDAHDTLLVSQALTILGFGVLPYMWRDSLTRVFYAYQDTRTPLIAGVVSIVLNYGLNVLLVERFDLAGIAGATTLVTLVNALLLSIFIRKHQAMPLVGILVGCWPMFVAAVLSFALGTMVMGQIGIFAANGLFALAAIILLIALVVLGSYAVLLMVFKEPLLAVVVSKLTAKFKKK